MRHWREVIAATGAGAAGLWLMALGGWLLVPVGLAVLVLAAGWAVIALRRLRFHRAVGAPGVVEVDEGQIGYFGPNFGGFLPIADLSELRLTDRDGVQQWRLKTHDAQVLLIPVAATGADRLFDVFATLPGIDMAAVTTALARRPNPTPIWTRPTARIARR
jgi:hypothetical protein